MALKLSDEIAPNFSADSNGNKILVQSANVGFGDTTIAAIIQSLMTGQWKVSIVSELPQIGAETTTYLVPHTTNNEIDYYEQYIWTDNNFRRIGNTQAELTGVLTNAMLGGESDLVIVNGVLRIKTSVNGVTLQRLEIVDGSLYAHYVGEQDSTGTLLGVVKGADGQNGTNGVNGQNGQDGTDAHIALSTTYDYTFNDTNYTNQTTLIEGATNVVTHAYVKVWEGDTEPADSATNKTSDLYTAINLAQQVSDAITALLNE